MGMDFMGSPIFFNRTLRRGQEQVDLVLLPFQRTQQGAGLTLGHASIRRLGGFRSLSGRLALFL